MNPTVKIALCAVSIGLCVACRSAVTGNEGNFEFSYIADDRVTDFNKPVAVGALLDLEVRDVGDRSAIDLGKAAFDDETVLTVVEFEGHEITIQGVGDGSALLEVEGTNTAGETLTDSVNMLARVPEVMKLNHPCELSGIEAYYLTDQRVWLPWEMEMANSQPVIGYGYYPVTVGGDGAATLNEEESGSQWLAFDTSAIAGTALLQSEIDDVEIAMNVVSAAAIDGVEEPTAFVVEDIDVGDTNAFYVRPQVGGVNVCQGDTEKTVVSDTPDLCTVTESSAPVSDTSHELGWFEVTGVSAGTCTYTVTFPAGNGGAGVSAQFEYPIEP